ncbi:hypothetical protein UFOVP184_37 [uncultured Caudovirales phage]|uniref:Uncharacterized protein n=1 Tax=uncultured Caudovirales phage TaxID=2100421 RepID=A0A6J7WCP0_9CAUD|nr:hypothetical protein UFOVP184_37 [uncultured Caudovirales phage]
MDVDYISRKVIVSAVDSVVVHSGKGRTQSDISGLVPVQDVNVKAGQIDVLAGAESYAFAGLLDVRVANITQGDLIAYSQPSSKWVNVKQSTVTDGGNF